MQTIPDQSHQGPKMGKEPQAVTTLESLREMVADYSSSHPQPERKPPPRGPVSHKLLWILLTVVLFLIGGYFLHWQEKKSAWEAELANLKSQVKIQGLSFRWDQVLPKWLYGKYGRRIVAVKYDRWQFLSGPSPDPHVGTSWEISGNSVVQYHSAMRTELSHDDVLAIGRQFQYVEKMNIEDDDEAGLIQKVVAPQRSPP
jgi:hypothetical protein